MRRCQVSGPGKVSKKGFALLFEFGMWGGFVGEMIVPRREGEGLRCGEVWEVDLAREGLAGEVLRARLVVAFVDGEDVFGRFGAGDIVAFGAARARFAGLGRVGEES